MSTSPDIYIQLEIYSFKPKSPPEVVKLASVVILQPEGWQFDPQSSQKIDMP